MRKTSSPTADTAYRPNRREECCRHEHFPNALHDPSACVINCLDASWWGCREKWSQVVKETGSKKNSEDRCSSRGSAVPNFLRLVGTGVGLWFVPASLAVLPEATSAQPTTPFVVPTILGGTECPIGLWWPPPPSQTTVQRYQEISAAGFQLRRRREWRKRRRHQPAGAASCRG